MSVSFAPDAATLARHAETWDGNSALAFFDDLAREHEIFLHLGSLAVALGDDAFANRSVLFGPDGSIRATYDKIHLFDADPGGDRPYRESATYRGGSESVLAQGPGFQLGLSVCYDVRFPQLYRQLAEHGADVLAVPAAFTVPTGRAHWEILLRARAIETGCFVIAAAQGGQHENGRETFGHSTIVSPWGDVLAQRTEDGPGLIFADLDFGAVAESRRRVPALANARAFSLSVNRDKRS
jgi:predicted amidohydrolase